MPRTYDLSARLLSPGWELMPEFRHTLPAVSVVEDDSPETWADFQRLMNGGPCVSNVNQRLLDTLGGILQGHVLPMFLPGTKVTLIARTPGDDGADVMVSNDNLDDLGMLIERGKQRNDIVPVTPR